MRYAVLMLSPEMPSYNLEARSMKITINNRLIETGKAVTILDAARQNDIYIPSLCAHPELTPFGGCRLCIVEIEGRKGYPTACTTQARRE